MLKEPHLGQGDSRFRVAVPLAWVGLGDIPLSHLHLLGTVVTSLPEHLAAAVQRHQDHHPVPMDSASGGYEEMTTVEVVNPSTTLRISLDLPLAKNKAMTSTGR